MSANTQDNRLENAPGGSRQRHRPDGVVVFSSYWFSDIAQETVDANGAAFSTSFFSVDLYPFHWRYCGNRTVRTQLRNAATGDARSVDRLTPSPACRGGLTTPDS